MGVFWEFMVLAHHGGFGLVALRIIAGNGRPATTAVALIEDKTREAEMCRLGERLGFAEQIECGAHALDDGDALIGEVHDTDAGNEFGGFHVT
ncbi:hypothetical protein WL77_11430 [Burkholderia ubonensis]|nr:hypothetical protein WL77_11430 [Burkholderia ubonensis]KWE74769.1 hypothetical protein WL79_13125 [Burkholderia ubonensis]